MVQPTASPVQNNIKNGSCDLRFTNAQVIDGTGRPVFGSDIAIKDSRIVAVGDLTNWGASRTIDISGNYIAPGFIDVHTHDDRAIMDFSLIAPKISQGVTTVVTGNCGVSLAPLVLGDRTPPSPFDALGNSSDYRYPTFYEYLQELENSEIAINCFPLVGHGTLRLGAVQNLDGPASAAQIDKMKAGLAEALEAGAGGMSSGLFYPTNRAAPKEEVLELAKLVGQAGGIYTAHIRDEADHVVEALYEAIDIAKKAKVPLLLSHHKVSGKQNFGRTRETLPIIARERTSHPISVDLYPYIASSTMLNEVSWSASSRTIISWSHKMPQASGRDLSEVAAELGLTEKAAIEYLRPAGGIYFMMHEADVQQILQFADVMIGSDGLPHDPHPHPRLWGSFTKVIRHYVKELGLMTLEAAIRRMTSLPAEKFKIPDRGVIAPGAFADLVVFSADEVADAATYENPQQPSHGIRHVFVNGAEVWKDGKATGRTNGRVLKRYNG